MSKRNMRHGYDFEAEVGKSLELIRVEKDSTLFYHKLVDTYAYDWIKEYIEDTPDNLNVHQTAQFKYNMILPKVPCDFLSIHGGTTSYMECKSTKDKIGFPVGNVKEHQLEMSKDIEGAGAPYYFLICKRQPYKNVMYVMRGSTFRKLIDVTVNGKLGKSKVPWSLIEHRALHVLPKLKGKVYDMSFVLSK